MCRCPVQGPQAAPHAQRQWLMDSYLVPPTAHLLSLPLTKIQWSRCNYYKQFYRQANWVTSGLLVSCSRKWKTESQTAWPGAFLNQEAVGGPSLPCWGSHENVPHEWCRKSEEEGKTGPFGGCLSQGYDTSDDARKCIDFTLRAVESHWEFSARTGLQLTTWLSGMLLPIVGVRGLQRDWTWARLGPTVTRQKRRLSGCSRKDHTVIPQ